MREILLVPTTMEIVLLAAALLFPLVLAAGFVSRAWQPTLIRLAPFSALPGLLVTGLVREGATLEIPWLFLGTRLGLDSAGQSFLLFTSLLWLVAGLYSRGYLAGDDRQARFTAFYLLAMSGNLGVVLAQDMAGFYLFFTLMSFSSYVLVVHSQDDFAVRAARIYLILAVIGEVMLFAALVLLAANVGTIYFQEFAGRTPPIAALLLIVLSFAIKAGALPVHFWLPLAHPAAPVPASAVLSGAMIKAGLLGWLRFLPLGYQELPDWGVLVAGMGIAAAFYGALIGIGQTDSKTVLAYSSISQMGLITIGVGIGLADPGAWPAAQGAILIYALHHALAKGALFLGVGVAGQAASGLARRLVSLGLLIPALALAGAPLTSGALAKTALKLAVPGLPHPWPSWLDLLLPLAAVGTTLLMARFLFLIWSQAGGVPHPSPGLWLPWALLLLGVSLIAWLWPVAADYTRYTLALDVIWLAFWPLGLGVLAAASLGHFFVRSRTPGRLAIPPGDMVVMLEWSAGKLAVWWKNRVSPGFARLERFSRPGWGPPRLATNLARFERFFTDFAIAGTLLLFTAAMMYVLLAIL